ncbi:MAG: Stp1/IreP family PP2C-type Ser/Thr phosphatase [Gammaproteobacteria bacterium]|nr:Stp1/IreP family PP2C-type Ser/Thr phosphatase [Gammaproteobacteria bacterium]
MANIRIWGVTDPGRQRQRNEDAIVWDESRGFAVLADGVGGQNAGDVASGLVVSILDARLRADPAGEPEQHLAAAVHEANAQIHSRAAANAVYAGMGSTVVAVQFLGRELVVAHVGDSRLYRWRAGALERLTLDHSLVQEMVSGGFMSAEEARASGHRHVITRALGSASAVDVEVQRHDLRSGDRLLLCSDGLNDLADDAEIAVVLARGMPPEVAALDLVALANEKGGSDNVSAIVVDVL